MLTCQVILNDFPRSNTSIGEGAVRWFHQDTSKDDMTKLEKNRGHAHEGKISLNCFTGTLSGHSVTLKVLSIERLGRKL